MTDRLHDFGQQFGHLKDGAFSARVGITEVNLHVDSGDLSAPSLPATLLIQYHFLQAGQFDPYLGFSPTWAKFYDNTSTSTLTALTGGTLQQPTLLDIDSNWGYSLQLGASVRLQPDSPYFVDASIVGTRLATGASLSTGQNIHVRLDPVPVSLAIGHRF